MRLEVLLGLLLAASLACCQGPVPLCLPRVVFSTSVQATAKARVAPLCEAEFLDPLKAVVTDNFELPQNCTLLVVEQSSCRSTSQLND